VIAYSLRRLVLGVGVLFAATFGLFWVIASRINPLWPYLLSPPKNPKVLADAKARAGVGMSIWERYWHWLEGAVHHGTFGRFTVIENAPVWPAIWNGLQQTAELATASVVVITVFSIVIGTIAATRPGSLTDVFLRGAGYITWSIPVFLVALGLQEIFVRIGLFGLHPFGSFFHYQPPSQVAPSTPSIGHQIVAWFGKDTLPVIAVSLTFVGGYSRYVRSAMLVALNAPYSVVARSKGLSERRVVVRHALRTALIPFVSILALDFGNLFSATLVADVVFSVGGLGSLFVSALSNTDPWELNALLGVTALTVIAFSLFADVVYGFLDPRIRVSA
jgi:peptide/nickel transport system permease protein